MVCVNIIKSNDRLLVSCPLLAIVLLNHWRHSADQCCSIVAFFGWFFAGAIFAKEDKDNRFAMAVFFRHLWALAVKTSVLWVAMCRTRAIVLLVAVQFLDSLLLKMGFVWPTHGILSIDYILPSYYSNVIHTWKLVVIQLLLPPVRCQHRYGHTAPERCDLQPLQCQWGHVGWSLDLHSGSHSGDG